MTASTQFLPDADARRLALTDHERTFLVEAGAGSGKTALIAGRVALLVAAGIAPGEIVAITFTEAAAAELRERIEGIVSVLSTGGVPTTLAFALPDGLTSECMKKLLKGQESLDEITCTTIHGFCQQLIRPYPVETGMDPGAAIIEPASAELAYQDLLHQWLTARFGRNRADDPGGSDQSAHRTDGNADLFVELLGHDPDDTLKLIRTTAAFLRHHPAAQVAASEEDPGACKRFVEAVDAFADWYGQCGIEESTTAETVADLKCVAGLCRNWTLRPGQHFSRLLLHDRPQACKSSQTVFKSWRVKGKWREAARAAGARGETGDDLFVASEQHYLACNGAYQDVVSEIGREAVRRFIGEFDRLRERYQGYKRDAALLDFDDLLYMARDLLKSNNEVRKSLSERYPRILVDEFQDTDPVQAEILWHLAGDGEAGQPWQTRRIRPGALFLVGDPKQAIYRFRGADVRIYQLAKNALLKQDADSVLEITTNFRTRAPILDYVNEHFEKKFGADEAQPGFAALHATRMADREPHVAALDVTLEESPRSSTGKVNANDVRREEAKTVAVALQQLVGAYPVWDREKQTYRPAAAGDIALLAPAGTALWIYEQALESLGTPIITQAGKGFFRRQEVQDLIAVARTIADARDTLAFGSLVRGPLVGLTEEEIADEIIAQGNGRNGNLNLWTPVETLHHPALREAMGVLQGLARKSMQNTPYSLLSEAVERLHMRAILQARHPRGAERAHANVERFLEMARTYESRGIIDLASALRQRWNNSEDQSEGRPDAQADAVSITTMHSAKGLEWPVVIPINTATAPSSAGNILFRREDSSIHLRIFGVPSPDLITVRTTEQQEQARERLRLWYVALTRARDLLLLPRHSERGRNDWFSLLDLDLKSLPSFEVSDPREPQPGANPIAPVDNLQDSATWAAEQRAVSASERQIMWHQPSRHDADRVMAPTLDEETGIIPATDNTGEAASGEKRIQGGSLRGEIIHKLMEEVLTGETSASPDSLLVRARALMAQVNQEDHEDPGVGLSSREIVATIRRGLEIPRIAELFPRLVPEFRVYGSKAGQQQVELTTGIVDALAFDGSGQPEAVIDWKSDVDPSPQRIRAYCEQIRDYLTLTGAAAGLLVFLTPGRIIDVEPPRPGA